MIEKRNLFLAFTYNEGCGVGMFKIQLRVVKFLRCRLQLLEFQGFRLRLPDPGSQIRTIALCKDDLLKIKVAKKRS